MGRYKTRQNFSPGLLPSRYAAAAVDDEYPEIVNLDETVQQQSQDKQQSQSMECNSTEKDEALKSAPKKAMIIAGVQPETVDMVQEVDRAENEEPQNTAQQAGNQANVSFDSL